MNLLTYAFLSLVASAASVLALPINLQCRPQIPRYLNTGSHLNLREGGLPPLTNRQSTHNDYATIVLREILLSALKERYMDTGLELTDTRHEYHYPIAYSSTKPRPSLTAARRVRSYGRRRRTQRKLRPEDDLKAQLAPKVLAREVSSKATKPVPSDPSTPADPSLAQVPKIWKKRMECRVLNNVVQCFKRSRIKPNSVNWLDAQGATPLRSE